jgi:hypothetical protein
MLQDYVVAACFILLASSTGTVANLLMAADP